MKKFFNEVSQSNLRSCLELNQLENALGRLETPKNNMSLPLLLTPKSTGKVRRTGFLRASFDDHDINNTVPRGLSTALTQAKRLYHQIRKEEIELEEKKGYKFRREKRKKEKQKIIYKNPEFSQTNIIPPLSSIANQQQEKPVKTKPEDYRLSLFKKYKPVPNTNSDLDTHLTTCLSEYMDRTIVRNDQGEIIPRPKSALPPSVSLHPRRKPEQKGNISNSLHLSTISQQRRYSHPY